LIATINNKNTKILLE